MSQELFQTVVPAINTSSALTAALCFCIWLRNGGLQCSSLSGQQLGNPQHRQPTLSTHKWCCLAQKQGISPFLLRGRVCGQSLQTSQTQGLRTLPALWHYMYLQEEAMSGIKSHEGKTCQFIIAGLPKRIIHIKQTDFFSNRIPFFHDSSVWGLEQALASTLDPRNPLGWKITAFLCPLTCTTTLKDCTDADHHHHTLLTLTVFRNHILRNHVFRLLLEQFSLHF